MAAWECGTVEFPAPPYPDTVICPPNGTSIMHIDTWVIVSKVRWEAVWWVSYHPPYQCVTVYHFIKSVYFRKLLDFNKCIRFQMK